MTIASLRFALITLIALSLLLTGRSSAAQSSACSGQWYRVQQGDSWSKLAQRTGLAVAVLKAANFRSVGLLRHLGFSPGNAADAKKYEAEQDELVMVKSASARMSRPPDFANPA